MKYFQVIKDDKNEINEGMNRSKEYWSIRPLTNKMLKYAAEDVLHLSRIYSMFLNNSSKQMLTRMFEESRQSIIYSYINLSINFEERETLSSSKDISGMLK